MLLYLLSRPTCVRRILGPCRSRKPKCVRRIPEPYRSRPDGKQTRRQEE